jgi:hypothetical protein
LPLDLSDAETYPHSDDYYVLKLASVLFLLDEINILQKPSDIKQENIQKS